MDANYYLEQLHQDMRLRAYSEHTQDVRNYVLHLMGGSLSKGSINTYQAAIRFFFGVTLNRTMNYLQMPRLKEDKALPKFYPERKSHGC